MNLASDAKKMENIDYLFQGYNAFFGNPHDKTTDPGFTKRKIFQFSYNEGGETADGRYQTPDFVDISGQVDCSLSFDSKAITGETSLTENM